MHFLNSKIPHSPGHVSFRCSIIIIIVIIQPAREARGPEGPARWER